MSPKASLENSPQDLVIILADLLRPHLKGAADDEVMSHKDLSKSLQRPVREAARRGELPASKIGRHVVFSRADFKAWLKRHRIHARKMEPSNENATASADEAVAPTGESTGVLDLAAQFGLKRKAS